MARQSISLTTPNNIWLNGQVESEEFFSKSEVVNDLIRKARHIETIQQHLVQAENSGFTAQNRSELINEFKYEVKSNG